MAFSLVSGKNVKTLIIVSLASGVRELATAAFKSLLPLKITNHLVALFVYSWLSTQIGY